MTERTDPEEVKEITGHIFDGVKTVVSKYERFIEKFAGANIKSHIESDFSFGMKLGVGFVHPLERFPMHRDHLREKIAEINLAVPQDLTIIDGRTTFITGGPDRQTGGDHGRF